MSRSMWTKPALTIAIVLPAITVVALGVCRLLNVDPHLLVMVLAMLIGIVAGEVSLLPLHRARRDTAAAIVQAGLIGMIVQLFVAVALSAPVIFFLHANVPFVMWLIPLHWVGQAMLAIGLVAAVKRVNPI